MQAPDVSFKICPGIGGLFNSMLAVAPVKPDGLYGATWAEYHRYTYWLIHPHGLSHITVDADNFADNGYFACPFRYNYGCHVRVFRLKSDAILLTVEAL